MAHKSLTITMLRKAASGKNNKSMDLGVLASTLHEYVCDKSYHLSKNVYDWLQLYVRGLAKSIQAFGNGVSQNLTDAYTKICAVIKEYELRKIARNPKKYEQVAVAT